MRSVSSMDVRSWLRLALPAVGLLGVSSIASAQEWILDPRLEVGAIYNDNIRVTAIRGQEIEVYGPTLDAQVTARKEAQAWSLEATPRLTANYFPDAKSEDFNNYYFDTRGERHTQRTQSGVILQFADESVVQSELAVADFPGIDLGQVVGGDAGEVTVRNRRTMYTIQPSFAYAWTERRHLTLDAHYTDVTFDDTLFEQVGFTDAGAAGGIVWDLTQRAKLSVDLFGTVYSPDDGSNDTTSTGLMAEWRMAPSETMTYYLRLGGNHAQRDAEGLTPKVSSSSFNGGVGVAWTYQVTSFVIDALRSTSPSSQGAVVNRDELRLRLNRAFSPKVTAYVAARGIRTSGIDNAAVDVRERKYYTGRTGFEWRMTREFALDGAYEYKWQKFAGNEFNATSNGVSLSVVYQPRRLMK